MENKLKMVQHQSFFNLLGHYIGHYLFLQLVCNELLHYLMWSAKVQYLRKI